MKVWKASLTKLKQSILYCCMRLEASFSQAQIVMEEDTETKAEVGELCIRCPSYQRILEKRPDVQFQIFNSKNSSLMHHPLTCN
jgi:hypothetical protein